ncbi:hypothetical protein E3E35_07860 [Thermococcus sp. GR7]|uniref:hypothetical protein n=1 Tax=unclassified Thermococcus TaxID=2627626 RepID=UPI00142FDC38|nr:MULTISPECIES: hypothetical protein [unclassified Thermococcus]NJE47313.1 hypothetical protein [Thermococcus sp. GR7]NJE78678.1 hypothetical protein [Thermococcus sp. GR4]NJF23197.1 hypothetical protein [Thermococcus sp. GR5]
MIGCFLLSIIQKRREKKGDEKKPRSSRTVAHKVATLVIFILLINAQYAAAIDLWNPIDSYKEAVSSIKEKISGAWDWLKGGRHLGTAAATGCFAYAMSSAAAGAVGGSVVPGLGTIAGAVGMALVAGTACYLGGAAIENWIKGTFDFFSSDDDDGGGLSILQPRNLSYNEYASRSTLLGVFNTTYVNLTELIQAEQKDFLELKARLAAQLIAYDIESTDGSTGEFSNVEIRGPDKIFGFSAIPVEFTLKPGDNPDVKDPICLTDVKLYVYTRDGRPLWTREWKFQPGEKCGESNDGTVWTFRTILKGPDPYENQVDAVLNGLATWDIVNQIYLATPADEPYEIVAEVTGIKQIYYSTGDGWIFDHNETISARWRTSSAYKHIAAGRIQIGGFSEGTLPIDYQDDPKARMFVPYLMRGSGAASNIIARAWVNPLHIINASSTYKIYIGANDQFFNLVPVTNLTVTDEARLVVYRLLKNGQWELAAALPISSMATLGDILSNPTAFEGTVTYHGASDIVTYMAFIGIKAEVTRDDGTKIPIWMLISPNIGVVSPERTVRLDPTFAQIEDLISDQEWTAYDAEQAKALVETIVQELEEKIASAEHYIEIGSQLGNQKVVDYATKAKEHYLEAITYAKKIPTSEKLEDTIRYLEIVRDEEMAGDYYLEAARLASYGAYDQAETMAETAEKIADVADEYKGTILGGIFGTNFQLGDLIWWLIALAIVAGVFYVLFGKRAAVLVAVLFLAFAVLDSNLIGAILAKIGGFSLLDKLKFW